MGLVRCFQSRLQLAALELGRSRADAEDLGSGRVTVFCQANAAFYAGLTETESTFHQLVDTVKEEPFFYTLERSVWMELITQLALHTAEREEDRQSVRLLHTAARFAEALQDRDRYDRLVTRARELDERLRR